MGEGRILVIRWGRLGDLLLAGAATREIARAFPEKKIDLAVRAEWEEAAGLLPGIDRVRTLEGSGLSDLLRFRREKLAGKYDAVVDLQGNLRSRILSARLGGRRVVYPRASLSRRLLVRTKRWFGPGPRPVWRRYLDAVEKLGVDVRPEPPRLLPVSEEGIPGAIAFAPGAGRATKRWPPERFASAIRIVHERFHRPILLIGARSESDLLERIAGDAGAPIEIAAGPPLRQSAALLRDAAILVTNDSGLMHLAAGYGTPVVALFGATVPELGFGPMGEKDIVISRELPCRPCSLHGTDRCPLPDESYVCMTAIEPGEVAEAVGRILRDSGEGVG